MQEQELSHYFPEMLKVLDRCHFAQCTHTHEPHCAVKEELERGTITEERYISYLNMLEEEEKYR
jgi:ribosome biogenesis GTPase